MRYFLTTTALILAFAASFNLWQDVSHRFWSHVPITSAWTASQCFVIPDQFVDRRYRVAHLRAIRRPDVVLLGSSRMMLVDSPMFDPKLRIFNASLSQATVEDYVAIWQALKNEGKLPARLMIFADPWIFNRNSEELRWQPNISLCEQFLREHQLAHPSLRWLWPHFLWHHLIQTFKLADLTDILSWGVLIESLKKIRPNSGPAKEDYITDIASAPSDKVAWRADGSVIQAQRSLQPQTLDEIRGLSAHYATQKDIPALAHYSFNSRAYDLLKVLVTDAQEHGTTVSALLLPFHPSIPDILSKRPPEYSLAFPMLIGALERLSAEKNGFTFCNAIDPSVSGCEESEFTDGYHMRRSCVAKVITHCLSQLPTRPLAGIGSR